MTLSIARSFAIVADVLSLSPVSIIISIPIFFNATRAFFALGFGVSSNAITPIRSLSNDTKTAVFPSFCKFRITSFTWVVSIPSSFIRSGLPTIMLLPL